MKTNNSKLVEGLNKLLADYHIYYQNLRAQHWNVKGNQFFVLHEKFEEYYDEAAEAIDEIAERILMIGGVPVHTLADYIKLTGLKEAEYNTDGKRSVEIVLGDNRSLLKSFYEVLELADGDEETVALLSDLIGDAEKRIWMLSALIG